MKKIGITLFVLAFSLCLLSCAKSKPEVKKEFSGIVTFAKGDFTVNNKIAKSGMKIVKSDILKTGEKSLAIVQFDESAVVTLRSNTVLEMNDYFAANDVKKSSVDLSLKQGKIYNKIVKDGTQYQVKTSTCVAGVRGTSFEISTRDNVAKIKLLRGKVAVSKVKNKVVEEKTSVILQPGYQLEAREKEISVPIVVSAAQKEELKVFDHIKIVPNLNNEKRTKMVTPEMVKTSGVKKSEIESLAISPEVKNGIISLMERENNLVDDKKNIAEKTKVAKVVKKRKSLTLTDLQKKYGELSVVQTKDGQKYIGSFRQQGDVVKVITVDRIETIKSENVSKISPYQNK